MKLTNIRKLAAASFASMALGVSSIASAADFSQIYIFGDSLSDSGNIYAFTGETSKAPYPCLPQDGCVAYIPGAAYAIGGHQFSNGKTWAQRFAQNLSLNKGGKASLDSPGKNGNYAFGGARANGGQVPSAAVQVGMYFQDHAGVADSEALYVVAFGGNDLRDALTVAGGGGDPTPIIGAAVQATATQIQTLYGAGARNFLVAHAPDLSHAPAVTGLEPFFPGTIAGAQALSFGYRAALNGALDALAFLPGITIKRLDLFQLLNDAVNNPGDFGLSNTTDTCITPNVQGGATCSNPSSYIFWDGIHPTSAMHDQVADIATALYNANW